MMGGALAADAVKGERALLDLYLLQIQCLIQQLSIHGNVNDLTAAPAIQVGVGGKGVIETVGLTGDLDPAN